MLDNLWKKFWYDRHGKLVIYQTPNFFLIAWVVLDIASLATSHRLSSVLWWLGTIDLAIWALLEIVKGVNYFRRLLGVIVLLTTIGMALKTF